MKKREKKNIIVIILLIITIIIISIILFYVFKKNPKISNINLNKNSDGSVFQDLSLISKNLGKSECNETNSWCANKDLNKDNIVNIKDLKIIAKKS